MKGKTVETIERLTFKGYTTSSDMEKEFAMRAGKERAKDMVRQFMDYESEKYYVMLPNFEGKWYKRPLLGMELLGRVNCHFGVMYVDGKLSEVIISPMTFETWEWETNWNDLESKIDFELELERTIG